MVLCASLLNQFDKKKMRHAPHFQRSFYFLLISDCRPFHDQMRKLYCDLLLRTLVVGVCVCVFSSHPFWTSSSLDVPAGVTQEEGHTGFFIHLLSAVRALIFVARRIQPFLSLVDREVEFCVLTI